jgi:hypothetical protein
MLGCMFAALPCLNEVIESMRGYDKSMSLAPAQADATTPRYAARHPW